MNRIILLVLLIAAQAHAGLFDNGEKQRQQYEQQIQHERQATGGWQIVAGILGLGSIILFGIGAAIGSKIRKEVKKDE